jgi:hypothetical protein
MLGDALGFRMSQNWASVVKIAMAKEERVLLIF